MSEIKLYTIAEVKDILKVTQRTVYKYVENGMLKGIKIGKYWRIPAESLEAFVRTGTNGSKPDSEVGK